MESLRQYSDEDLAELMKMAISESNDSEYASAFTEFFERYQKLILYLCRKFAGKRHISENLADEIFSEFFFKFKSKIPFFDPSKARSVRPLRAWFVRVLQRVALDIVKKYQDRRNGEILLSEQEWEEVDFCEEEDSSCEQIPSAEKQKVSDALEAQSERNKGILLEYYLRKPLSSSQRNSKGVYADIGSQFGTSAENVKKIILRFRQNCPGHIPQ